MALTLVEITGPVKTPDGVVVTGGYFDVWLSQPTSGPDGETYATNRIHVAIGSDGTIGALSLAPNCGTAETAMSPLNTYYFAEFHPRQPGKAPQVWTWKWQITAGAGSTLVGDVPRIDEATTTLIAGDSATIAARDSAQASQVAAAASQSAAAGSASAAATAQGIAEGARDAAIAARDDVTSGLASKVTAAGGDASATVVTPAGSATARTMAQRFADVIWAADYVAADGTDETTGLLAAITQAMATGKEVRLPTGTVRADGQIVLPNDGQSLPRQRPLRIVGSGATMSGRGVTAPYGGSVLDLRYAGTRGKILTSGLGLLDVTGLTFMDSAGSSLPWLYTTNTTLHVHGVAFVGSKVGTACDQDCIILGGNTEVEGAGGLDDGFQGYGSIIRDNHFHRIRRAVYGRTFANAVVVRDNTVWSNCGSNLAGGAAIEFDNPAVGATQYDTGNVIAGNLIEVTNYPYAIKIGRGTQNTISGNNVFDAGAGSLAAVRFEASAVQNTLIDGYCPGALAAVSDASTNQVNTHIATNQGVASRFATAGAWVFQAEGNGVEQESGASTVPYARFRERVNGDTVYQRLGGVAGAPGILFYSLPNGGSAQALGFLKTLGANQAAMQIWGSAFAGLEAPDGDLKVRVKTGSTLWFGDMSGQSGYWQQSTKTFVLNDAAAMVRFGSSSGPMIRQGTGTPEAAVAAPVGSLYLRNDGVAGTTLYVKESGTGNTGWIAK